MPSVGIEKERSLTLTSWNLIKEEYAAGEMSYRALAKKHGVSLKVLSKTAHAEGWPALRRQKKQGVAEPPNSCAATSEESSSEKKAENIHSEQSFNFEETENERSKANGDGNFLPPPEPKEPPNSCAAASEESSSEKKAENIHSEQSFDFEETKNERSKANGDGIFLPPPESKEPPNSCAAASEESSSEKKTENTHSEQSFNFEETENERSEANGDGDGIFLPPPEPKEPLNSCAAASEESSSEKKTENMHSEQPFDFEETKNERSEASENGDGIFLSPPEPKEPINSCAAASEESSSEKKTGNIHSEQSFDFEETKNERSKANGDGDGIFLPPPEPKEPPDILTVADQLLVRVSEMVHGANAQALKSLSGTLKDLKEITGFKTEDERLEQDARLRKLRRESMRDEDLLSEIEVVLRAGPEAWNE